MAAHARLSPSSAERWISCPASIRMGSDAPAGPSSVYADEGTAAHALGELKVRLAMGWIKPETYDLMRAEWRERWSYVLTGDEDEVEMDRHTDAYVALIFQKLEEFPNSALLLEQRMDTGVPDCWGTGDAVIVSPIHVEVVDLKYGQGIQVQAIGNPQLRLYGLAALRTFADILGETEFVRVTVHQPRLNHVLSETLTPDELRSWRDQVVLPRAELALTDDAPFGPSEDACRWCPASGRCIAQLEQVFAELDLETDPRFLGVDQIAKTLPLVGFIRDWLSSFEEAALQTAYSDGRPIPGYKVVLSGGKRSIQDPEGAIAFLTSAEGYTEDDVAVRKIRGIGELEKLMGKEQFATVLEPYIKPPTGKPAIVPEGDKRPPISPSTEAQKVFGTIEGEPEA